MHSYKRTFYIGILNGGLTKISGRGLKLFMNIYLARILLNIGYGEYKFGMSIIKILMLFCVLGFTNAWVKYTAKYIALETWDKMRGFFTFSLSITLLSSLICLTISVIVLIIIYYYNGIFYNTVCYALFAVPFLVLNSFFTFIFNGYRKILISNLLSTSFVPILLMAIVFIYYKMTGCISVQNVFVFYIFALSITVVVGALFFKRTIFPKIRNITPAYEKTEWLTVSINLMLASSMFVVMSETCIICIKLFCNNSEVAYYAASVQIAVLPVFTLGFVNKILAPMIADFYHTGQKAKLQDILDKASTLNFLCAFSTFLFVLFFGKYILSFFGDDYKSAFWILIILLLSQCINSMCGCVSQFMFMSKHHRPAFYILSLAALVNIIVNIILTPTFTAIGAAIAYLISMALWNFLMLIYVIKFEKVYPMVRLSAINDTMLEFLSYLKRQTK